jgi:hypothetical protein
MMIQARQGYTQRRAPAQRLRVRCAPAWSPEAILAAVAAHRQILKAGGPRLIQARHWRPVTRVDVAGRELAVKQYSHGAPGSRLRAALFGSRARRAWRGFQQLRACRLPAAPPAACVEAPVTGGGAGSYLVTEWIEGSHPAGRLRELSGAEARGAFATAAGMLIGTFHAQGAWIEDFRNENFIVPAGERATFVLIDYDSIHFSCLTGSWQLRNLRQFYRGVREGDESVRRRRFARAYLQALGLRAHEERIEDLLVSLLDVPSHDGILRALCDEYWRRIRPLAGHSRLGALRKEPPDA